MRKLGLVVGFVIVLLVLAVGVAILIGSKLPKSHVVSRSILLNRSPREVYAVARDFASAPAWRSEVKHVEVEQVPSGALRFRETGKHGAVNYELVEDAPGAKMVTRILDTNLGYSGRWTYVFRTEGGGTRITITEEGEVSNVLFRFMSRYIFGHTATLDGYLEALARHFGEDVSPQSP